MSIEYVAIGGVGIKFTSYDLKNFAKNDDKFSEELWADDPVYCLNVLGISAAKGGVDTDVSYYGLVPGKTFVEVKQNVAAFLDKLATYGVFYIALDLIIVRDIYIF